ncbi:secreted protein [Beggiatoa sp. SS]|nr:secreted protein [Beggiatoa sp. SS]
MITHLKQHTLITVFSLWLVNTALAAPTIQLSPNTPVSGGEEIHLTATGGDPPYTWAFESNTMQGMDSQNSVVQISAPQTAGTYQVSVKDNAGNEATRTVTVIQPLDHSTGFLHLLQRRHQAGAFHLLKECRYLAVAS